MARDAQLEISLLPVEPGDPSAGLCKDTPGSRVTFGMGLRKPGMRGSCRGKAPLVPLDGGETGSPAQAKGMTQEVIPHLPSLWNTKELGMMKHSDK